MSTEHTPHRLLPRMGGLPVQGFRLVYHSPTGTTRRVLQAISIGLGGAPLSVLDMTGPASERWEPIAFGSELMLIGAPVHAGQLPPEAVRRFRLLRGNQTPAVPVVVYGNPHYDDALLELADLTAQAGFVPVAGAAFIGEHSFSRPEFPIAAGRPDADDARRAAEFGRQISLRLDDSSSCAGYPPLELPGKRPYMEMSRFPNTAPALNRQLCTACSLCAETCPVGAAKGESGTDETKCVLCHACVRNCPTGARRFDDPRVARVTAALSKRCSERREPEMFL